MWAKREKPAPGDGTEKVEVAGEGRGGLRPPSAWHQIEWADGIRPGSRVILSAAKDPSLRPFMCRLETGERILRPAASE